MKKQQQKLFIWGGFAVVLVASLIAEKFIQVHAVFGPEGKIFFHAWFGFSVCVGMVVISKILGLFLKRAESYYKESDDE